MDRIALLTLPLFATVGLVPTKAADLVTQTDVAAVMTAVPSEGAAHHALAKRQADELSLTDADRPRQIMGSITEITSRNTTHQQVAAFRARHLTPFTV